MIRFHRNEATTTTGYVIPKDTFFCTPLDEAMRGYPFVHLLNDLSGYSDWLDHMSVSTHPYFNVGFGLPSQGGTALAD
jgi:hypothetical protein